MRSKILVQGRYRVVGVMVGRRCPAEDFLATGEAANDASRRGLMTILMHVANNGLQGVPRNWTHEVNKQAGICEFIKGDLRLYFFKGSNGDIAVCTTGLFKKQQKADKASIAQALEWRQSYERAVRDGTYEVIKHVHQ
ncbi:hypothetical protein [Roseateles sp.]|uniref:hypothetical protein n=1 Tax=Roseateles sp. TaxID=1971397 RepID=UPI0031DD9D24